MSDVRIRADQALREFGRRFPPHIKERGKQLLAEGLLEPVVVEETGYASIAHGQEDYEVAIFEGELFCECPYRSEEPHV